ncbi:MAG: Methylmalonyl-CoA mutase large subunit [Alphaproteobacteria bacterium MarineAlpha6_Bin6]|nr:protein meaA [Pelagibacteraceae bacterium]PPR31751.1 MAG: Methylmalonyl-CoA mutase large subunit [Alphaproteobacteria bacterium MarineAlpha6_Bin6]PPR33976.1 MAG: Methylmalonyl-CoA mutase large subunit [Alphaproteobacteria bacterium MarineAlpha6_Bin5]|tara:strand:- start:5004 stop:6983 length:1980 start_codon:yes stop_codon:yes gene_type:complete
MNKKDKKIKDDIWLIRTYSGHSSAKESNKLYKMNLKKGQTGLSVAFDLPTQTGYDSDHILAQGEVGKVGVPICHLGDMLDLFDGIPIGKMNTSMTINATAAWLLSLYIAAAEKRGFKRRDLQGTTQNDIIKEYLSRGTYIFPPKESMKLTSDIISFTYKQIPKWNPINICSYHLQEVGATPEQEISYALSNACEVLNTVKNNGQVPKKDFPLVVGRISFFVNAGIRFITEMCKMRAMTNLWRDICTNKFKIKNEKFKRLRYGVQVNSLGLTEPQPENNVYRILLEMLSVVLSKDARARAVQLPAWNEALGLPRPWDQQWSIRLQQIIAYETDLLEYQDIFDGSKIINNRVKKLKEIVNKEMRIIEKMGGAVAAVENSYMKNNLVKSMSQRVSAIENAEQVVVGVNKFKETAESPLKNDKEGFVKIDINAEKKQIKKLKEWRKKRNEKKCISSLKKLEEAALSNKNIMEASIECAHSGVTTGEWTDTLRKIYGEYRAPTGVGKTTKIEKNTHKQINERINKLSSKLKRRVKLLVGKPGLDGHSSGAEQISVAARDSGMEVVYQGIRLTPEQIVNTAIEESVHMIALSILSGSHLSLTKETIRLLKKNKISKIPLVVGGIIPKEDEKKLLKLGVSRVYTPKNYDINSIMTDFAGILEKNYS